MGVQLVSTRACRHNAPQACSWPQPCPALPAPREQIKKLEGLEPVQDTLKQLWMSYNNLAGLGGIEKLTNLEVLFLSNNKISSWSEVERLANLPKLRDVLLVGNPIHAKGTEEGNWRIEVLKRLPNLKVMHAPT